MNIFIREMKANRKSMIIWGFGVLFMLASGMAKFSAYSSSSTPGQSMNALIDKFPKILKAIFGIGSFDLSTAMGEFAVMFFYLVLMATIHASMLGAGIISKEERDKTTEFLFVKPVSRNNVITAKLLAALANIAIFNVVTLIFSLAIVGKYANIGEAIAANMIKLMLGMFVLQLLYLTIGMGIAAVAKNPKSATGVATGVLLTTFMLSIIVEMSEKMSILRYLTPFEYFDAKNILNNSVEPVYFVLSVIIIAFLIGFTYGGFRKRDLKV